MPRWGRRIGSVIAVTDLLRVPKAPARAILAAAVGSAALVAFLVWVATHSPWLGVDLQAATDAGGLRVRWVDPGGPAAGHLQAGDVVTHLATSNGDATPLNALSVARSGHLFTSYASVHRYLVEQQAMYDAARRGTVWLVLSNGDRVPIDSRPARPVRALSFDFWLAAALAAAALLAVGAVLAFRHREPVVRFFFMGTLGFAGTQATAAVIFGRELLFDARWGELAVAINLGSRLLSYWSLVMMLWVYPRRFRSALAGIPIAVPFVLAWLGEVLQWWPRPNLATPLMATLTTLVVAPLLGAWQLRATRQHPLHHIAAKVMVLSFALPTLVLTLTYQLPRLFGRAPLIQSIPALSAINLLMFVGFALGIARYRLFQLGRWWFVAMAWALGGALVIGLDLLFLWLQASTQLALGLALAIAGWAYFPLRQWIWRRFGRWPGPFFERHLSRLVDHLFQSASTFELTQRWRKLLEEVFQPLITTMLSAPSATARLVDEGMSLAVPGLRQGETIVLEHAARGTRLFDPADVELARELLALSHRAADARQALDQRQAEREQMVQDLHDGLGGLASNIALLAGMAKREAPTPELGRTLGTIEMLAVESLAEIRGFMNSLDAQDADWHALAADMRSDGGRRVEPHGLAFEMSISIDPASPPPEPLLRLNLPRLFHEAVNNVVKHAEARRIEIRLDVGPAELALTVSDDGRGMPDADGPGAVDARTGGRSRGMGIMQRRAHQLGGRLDVACGTGTTLRLTVPLPLQSPSPGIPAMPGHR